jgi:hypothetical protein
VTPHKSWIRLRTLKLAVIVDWRLLWLSFSQSHVMHPQFLAEPSASQLRQFLTRCFPVQQLSEKPKLSDVGGLSRSLWGNDDLD